jgi:hypothetical protein
LGRRRTLPGVPKELQPSELAALVDFAERPRTADWSLRAALVRYAEGEPQRVSDLLEQVRRVEGVIHGHRKLLEQHGPELWAALTESSRPEPEHATLVAVLAATRELDRAGEALATWAVDRAGERPDSVVDGVTTAVGHQLDEIGVPREPRDGQRPRGGRGV